MRDVQELRLALDEHASLAPDGTGLVEAARAGAARVRRRRRIAYVAAVLAVTALVAVAPAALSRLLADTAQNEPAAPSPGQLQLSASLAKNSGYYAASSGRDRNQQVIFVRAEGKDAGQWNGDVRVFDPGTFDPAPLLRGEKVTVRGHTAYFVPNLLVSRNGQTLFGWFSSDSRAPAVGWLDRSGAWVVVFAGSDGLHPQPDRKSLLRLADAVRLGPPRDIMFPYQLRFVPDGLPASYAKVGDGDHWNSVLAFGVDPTPPPQPAATSLQPPLNIQAFLLDHSLPGRYGPPTHKIAGYDAWYFTDRRLVSSATGAVLIVNPGNCAVEITVDDRKQITLDELKRMVERAEFKDCAVRSTWTRPLP